MKNLLRDKEIYAAQKNFPVPSIRKSFFNKKVVSEFEKSFFILKNYSWFETRS